MIEVLGVLFQLLLLLVLVGACFVVAFRVIAFTAAVVKLIIEEVGT